MDCGTHGVCMGGACRCEEGWTGAACDQRMCNPLCVKHGTCKDGKCECSPGWNGEHCTIGRRGRGRGQQGIGGWRDGGMDGWMGKWIDMHLGEQMNIWMIG